MCASICELLNEVGRFSIARFILTMQVRECDIALNTQKARAKPRKPPNFLSRIFRIKREPSINEIMLRWRVREFEEAKEILMLFEQAVIEESNKLIAPQ